MIRHAYIVEREDSVLTGLTPFSTQAQILEYTSVQSAKAGAFHAAPPRYWVVLLPEGNSRARLWGVVENHGEISNDGRFRTFDLEELTVLDDLRGRLVIRWNAPRAWRVAGNVASAYPVLEIADTRPVVFPGFDRLVLDYPTLQTVMSDPRYESWRTALASVKGIYLITDMRDGRQYVGKADGAENVRQRWRVYAQNGNGGNVELRGLDPATFTFSLLRVFDPAVPAAEINDAESHFKRVLGTREHGLNRN